jgi:hypothetical protein
MRNPQSVIAKGAFDAGRAGAAAPPQYNGRCGSIALPVISKRKKFPSSLGATYPAGLARLGARIYERTRTILNFWKSPSGLTSLWLGNLRMNQAP